MSSEEETMGIKALELISYLNDRPCEACEFHKENGCSRWDCVFEEVIIDDTNRCKN